MADNKYNRIGNFFTILVLIIAVIIGAGFIYGGSYAIWILSIANILCGPICLILYLIEIKKGVFSNKEE